MSALFLYQVLVNGPQTPLATQLKPAEVHPHVPEVPLGKDNRLFARLISGHTFTISFHSLFGFHKFDICFVNQRDIILLVFLILVTTILFQIYLLKLLL